MYNYQGARPGIDLDQERKLTRYDGNPATIRDIICRGRRRTKPASSWLGRTLERLRSRTRDMKSWFASVSAFAKMASDSLAQDASFDAMIFGTSDDADDVDHRFGHRGDGGVSAGQECEFPSPTSTNSRARQVPGVV